MALVSAGDMHLMGTVHYCLELGRWPVLERERDRDLFITEDWDITQGVHLRGTPYLLDFGYDEE